MRKLFSKLRQIRWKRWLGIPAFMVVILAIGFQAMVRTDWFQRKVRDRVITELERATGGRVELGTFLFDPARMTIHITKLVVHGREQPPDPPLLSVPALRVDLSLQSLFAARVAVRAVEARAPEIHVMVAADGTTNLPGAAQAAGSENPVVTLLDLAVDRFEVADGSFYWNSVAHRLSMRGQGLRVETRYEPEPARYAATIHAGQLGFDVAGSGPVISEAEAEVHVYRDRIEAPKITVNADGSRLQAQARLTNWEQPQVEAAYQVHAALGTWKQRLNLPLLGDGAADLRGQLAWRSAEQSLAYSGSLEAAASLAGGEGGEAQPVHASGDYSGDEKRAQLRNLDVSALQGRFRGEAELEGLQLSGPSRWRLSGDFDGYSIQSVLGAARTARIGSVPRDVPWSSQLSGWLRAEGAGLGDADIAASVVFASPDAVAEGHRPLQGVVDIVYRGSSQVLQLSRLDLSTNSSQIAAHGSITNDNRSVLDLRVTVKDLSDVEAFARLVGVDASHLPIELQGESTLEGNLAGRLFLDRPPLARFSGRLEATDFRASGYDWKHFSGQIELQPDQLHLQQARLEDPDGSAQIQLAIPLHDYRLLDSGPVSGNVSFADLSLQRLLAAAGRSDNVSGRLGGEVRVAGSVKEPELDGRATLQGGQAWGEPFQSASVAARYAAGHVEVSSFDLVKNEARVSGQGEYNVADRGFRFDLRGSDWTLQQFERFARASRPAQGDIQAELHASGRLGQTSGPEMFEELDVSGDWSLRNVTFGQQQVGSLTGKIATQGKQVHLDWQADLLGGEVHGQAQMQPAGDRSFQGQMEFKRVQALAVAQLAALPVEDIEGELDGGFTFSGDLSQPNSLKAEGTITRLGVGLAQIPGAKQGYNLWNPFPMRWSLAQGRLTLDAMRLLGQGTDIAINGSLPFSVLDPADKKLDVTVEGDFNLSVLESFRAGVQASGVSTVEINIRGGMDEPQLRGRLQLRNASLRSSDLPNGLSDMAGTLTFTGRRVRIDELKATSGGGTVQLSGTAVYEGGSASYRLTADAQQVRLRYPTNMSSTIDGRLTFSGNDLQTLLSGDIRVIRLATSPELDLGAVIASLGEPQRTPPGNALLRNTQLNVRIGSVPDLPVQTSMFRNVQLEIDMRLVGTAVSPSLLGNIGVTQGEMRFQGTRYVINRGEIDFTNPFRIEPVLDFELETRIRDVDIALNISGPARKMNLSYRSDPPLEFNQLVSLIAVGRSPTTDPVLAAQERVEAQPLLQVGANTLLSQALSRPFSKGLQRFFGVSRLRVDPQVGGAETVPTARISTEQQITTDLTLIYSYNLADSEQQSVRVEWAPSRRLSFIVTRDENGLVGADVLYKKRLP